MVHGILEDHNGYIIVDTQLGKGTTFSLYFITSRDFDHTNGDINELKTGHGERILVVDDDPIQRSVADNLLKRLGYEVHSVQSGEEAVNYVKENPQDLLLLDMVMNGIDGVETFRQILEFQSDQKALILSGYAMSERVQEALSLGVGGFVAKPVTPNVLANAIQKELHKSDAKNDGHS
ncbi:MAG: response regulator [bacterium]